MLTRFRVRCYSAKKGRKSGSSRLHKVEPEAVVAMEQEKDAFFVVRKGDVVGIYDSLSDCQAQVGSSVISRWNPKIECSVDFCLVST